MGIEINVDYMVSSYDQDNNTVSKALGLAFEVFDINITAEYTYRSGRPQTQYEPEEYSYFEVESYHVAGVYNDEGRFVPITKDQSDIILNLKPWVVDSDKLTDTIGDSHTDKDQEDYRA
jgi:hypothetical protein